MASSFHWKDLLLSQLNPLNPKPSIVRILSLLSDGLVWAQKIYEFFHSWPCRRLRTSSKTNTLHLPKNIIFTLCKSLLSPKLRIFTQLYVIPLLFIIRMLVWKKVQSSAGMLFSSKDLMFLILFWKNIWSFSLKSFWSDWMQIQYSNRFINLFSYSDITLHHFIWFCLTSSKARWVGPKWCHLGLTSSKTDELVLCI